MVHRSLIVLAVAALALSAPALSSAGSRSSTKVVISFRLPAFHGTLKSPTRACTHSRSVKLFRKVAGPDKLVGVDKSNSRAEWAVLIGGKLPHGASYYAKAPGTRRCRAAKSKVLSLG